MKPLDPNSTTVELLAGRSRKTYREGRSAAGLATEYFQRELAAYQWFAVENVGFVPRLLEYNENELWFETETIAEAITFLDWLKSAPSNSLEPVISQLIAIDKYLYEHHINYLQSSPADVLIDRDFHVYLIDFKHTFLNQRFEDILFERMFHFESAQARTDATARVVLATLATRRNEFHRFLFRKTQNHTFRYFGLFQLKRFLTQ